MDSKNQRDWDNFKPPFDSDLHSQIGPGSAKSEPASPSATHETLWSISVKSWFPKTCKIQSIGAFLWRKSSGSYWLPNDLQNPLDLMNPPIPVATFPKWPAARCKELSAAFRMCRLGWPRHVHAVATSWYQAGHRVFAKFGDKNVLKIWKSLTCDHSA